MTFDQLLYAVYNEAVQPVLLVLLAIAAIWFVYGLSIFIWNVKTEEKRTKGLRHLNEGLTGLVIMFSVFGLISVLAQTLKVDDPSDKFDQVSPPDSPISFPGQ